MSLKDKRLFKIYVRDNEEQIPWTAAGIIVGYSDAEKCKQWLYPWHDVVEIVEVKDER